jgi:acetylornithine deacetylase/succinyl-diaminopimelate desuccinylase-like protein
MVTAGAVSSPVPADLAAHAAGSETWFRDSLRMLVEHRTVSPGKTDDRAIRAGAVAARDLMRSVGAEAELVESSGTPSVLGRFRHPNPRARIVLYNHLDVQPAEGSEWKQADPFAFEVEPHAERGFLYRGRGATDDKGPALCGLRAASFIAAQKLPIDVSVLWETEEEIGSPHFPEIVAASRETLSCDAVIVSDTVWPSDTQPAVSVGLRGSLHAQLHLRTAAVEVHSGMAGGVARNPVRELCRLAAAIEQARFWREGALPPTAAEVDDFIHSGFELDYFRRAYHLEKLETDVPLEMMLRLWARPTFEVHALLGGYSGPGVKTSIAEAAEMKVSFRLVPEQQPEAVAEQLARFVHAHKPDIEIRIAGFLRPYRGIAHGRVHEAILEGLGGATGRAPVRVREGGSIGAVPILHELLGVPVHFLPLSLPEHGYHAPNEFFDWKQARVGIEAFGRTFAALAAG